MRQLALAAILVLTLAGCAPPENTPAENAADAAANTVAGDNAPDGTAAGDEPAQDDADAGPDASSDQEAGVAVDGAWVRLPTMETDEADMGDMHMAGNGALYMVIRDLSGNGDRLTQALGDAAEAIELHTTAMDDGVMRMRPVEAIEVPPGGEVTLEPGGHHVMLIGVTSESGAGDTIDFTLVFENAGEVPVTATVGMP